MSANPAPLPPLVLNDALRRRIEAFAALPVASLDRISLQNRVDQIDAHELAKD